MTHLNHLYLASSLNSWGRGNSTHKSNTQWVKLLENLLGTQYKHINPLFFHKYRLTVPLFTNHINHTLTSYFFLPRTQIVHHVKTITIHSHQHHACVDYCDVHSIHNIWEFFQFLFLVTQVIHMTYLHIMCTPHNNCSLNRNKINCLLIHKHHNHHI